MSRRRSSSSLARSAKKNWWRQAALDELVASYAAEERGIEIRPVAGGYKMYTKPQHHDVGAALYQEFAASASSLDARTGNAGRDCV